MPMPAGTRYRYKKGTNVRLAFAPGSNKVLETKNMQTGDTHMMPTSHMPKGAELSPKGDIGAHRVAEGEKAGRQIKAHGKSDKASSYLPYGAQEHAAMAIDGKFGPGDKVC